MLKKFLIIEDFISKEALSGVLLFIATVAAFMGVYFGNKLVKKK